MSKFKSQFKDLNALSHHIVPSKEWVHANREKLLRQIQNSNAFEKRNMSFLSMLEFWMPKSKFLAPMRFALVMLVIFGMTIGSWIAGVSASNQSLPGDVLYKVKIASENTQLALTAFDGEKQAENKAKLQLQFAERRSKEVKQLVAKQKPEATVHVQPTIQKLQETIKDAQITLKEVKKESNENVLDLAKTVTEATSVIAKDLKEVTENSPAKNAETAGIVKQVVEATKVVNDTGLQAIEVVLNDKMVVDATSKQEIKELVQEKVNILVQNIEDSKVAVEEVKQFSLGATTTFEVKLNVSSTAFNMVPSTQVSNSSTTTVQSEDVKKAGETIKEADKVASELKVLLQENHVTEAIEKAKTLNSLTTETQQAIVDSKVKVNLAVPSVSSSTVNPATSTEQKITIPLQR